MKTNEIAGYENLSKTRQNIVYRIFKTSKLFDDTKPNSYYKKMAAEAIEFAKELLPEKTDASEMPANVQKSVSAIQKNELKSVFAIQK